jgi:hypothetical protein
MKPPIPKPISMNDTALISPRYSGEKKRNGTPKARPNPSEIIENNKVQYTSEMRLYFTIPKSNSMGKKTRIELRINNNFRKVDILKYTIKNSDSFL